MKKLLVAGVTALALTGCSGMAFGPGGIVSIQTNPAADAMRTCAALADVVTPGVSPMAAYQISKGALTETLALGNTAAGALRNCARIIDGIND